MRLRNKNVRKKFLICTLTVFLVALVGFAGLVSYAYFSTVPRVYTEDGTKIARLGMNLSLLFDKLDPDEVDANTDLGILKPKTENEAQTTYGYDPSAKWGSTLRFTPPSLSDFTSVPNSSTPASYVSITK